MGKQERAAGRWGDRPQDTVALVADECVDHAPHLIWDLRVAIRTPPAVAGLVKAADARGHAERYLIYSEAI